MVGETGRVQADVSAREVVDAGDRRGEHPRHREGAGASHGRRAGRHREPPSQSSSTTAGASTASCRWSRPGRRGRPGRLGAGAAACRSPRAFRAGVGARAAAGRCPRIRPCVPWGSACSPEAPPLLQHSFGPPGRGAVGSLAGMAKPVAAQGAGTAFREATAASVAVGQAAESLRELQGGCREPGAPILLSTSQHWRIRTGELPHWLARKGSGPRRALSSKPGPTLALRSPRPFATSPGASAQRDRSASAACAEPRHARRATAEPAKRGCHPIGEAAKVAPVVSSFGVLLRWSSRTPA